MKLDTRYPGYFFPGRSPVRVWSTVAAMAVHSFTLVPAAYVYLLRPAPRLRRRPGRGDEQIGER